MIIEYGHIYVNDIRDNKIDRDNIAKSINIAKEQNLIHKNVTNVVLVDDKDYSLTEKEKKDIENFIRNEYLILGLEPHKVFFEKSFKEYENLLLRLISEDKFKSESFRKDKKIVKFLKSESHKIPIVQIKGDESNYSCQFLSSLWLLHKKGMLMNNQCKSTLTILSSKYKTIEEQVLIILNSAGYTEDKLGCNDYIWID